MFERTDVYPDRRLSSFCWMLIYCNLWQGEQKKGRRRVSRQLLRAGFQEPVESVRAPEFDARLE